MYVSEQSYFSIVLVIFFGRVTLFRQRMCVCMAMHTLPAMGKSFLQKSS